MSDRTSRQNFLGAASDVILRGLTFGIVGLGGGGSHIAQQLAHLGVGAFVLLDPDRIEHSNLNRLVGGTEADVRSSRSKVAIASRTIKRVNSAAKVTAKCNRWQECAEPLRASDIIFGCVDSFAARDELERFARRFLIPYIDIGMDVHEAPDGSHITGQVALSMPDGPCLHCMNVLRPDLLAREAGHYGRAGSRPQVVWANGALASMAVGVAGALITPWSNNLPVPILLEYDGNLPSVALASSTGFLAGVRCEHFSRSADIGDPWFASDSRRPSRRRTGK